MTRVSNQPLRIPPEEIGRQAVNSLRGYIYQVYQSLAAWLSLSEDETLLLEVAEDYAVLARSTFTAVQIKDTAETRSVTLKSAAISKAIQAFWNFHTANPDRHVRFHYLTKSAIGKEKALKFPDGQPGLLYWRTAAREGSDVEPIRQALLTLKFSNNLKGFIEHASAAELRDGLLRRIKWECGTGDISAVDQAIKDRLVYLGEKQHLTPSDSERSHDALVAELLRVIVRESGRELSRADLLRIFEKSVSVSMPIQTIRQAFSQAMASPGGGSLGTLLFHTSPITNAARAPLPPGIVDRKALVDGLASETGQFGALWLQGSSGLGKTVLAQLIARRSECDWFLVELRGCSGSELEYRLRTALAAINARSFGGIILDDFPMEHASSGRLRLSILTSEIQRCDGALVVTSTRSPSPSLEGCFGEAGVRVRDVPYLTEENVMELVRLAGGDPDKWAKIVHTFCGFGHPQLVGARISGLRHRGWPEDELLAGMPLIGGAAKEVDDERTAIRARLFAELPENARELLYRLTLITSSFDRILTIAVGEVGPTVPRPGEAFDLLVGPWVEVRGKDRFRVSPLIGDAGAKNLSTEIQLFVHRQIVDQLITRKPFPADFLGQLLNHALISRHEAGLTWLSMAVYLAKDEDRRMICEQLFVLALLDTSKPLFPENIYISTVLRLAQLDVAIATDHTDQLEIIADRLIAEARMLDLEDVSKGFVIIAICKVLMERSLPISPKKWIPMLEEFEELLAGDSEFMERARALDAVIEGIENWTVSQVMFVNRATALNGVDDLVALFEELDRLNVERRNVLLSAFREPYAGWRLTIHSAWLAETREGLIDGILTAEKYGLLVPIAER